MANRRPKTRGRGKAVKGKTLPFSRTNYLLFLIGFAVIVLGYIALSRPPASNFWSLTVAPILLVAGYCVIIPIAIILKGKTRDKEKGEV
jgi:quinol-cytochrome oxidoreductase complex cytochrome b subunit